MHRDTQLSRWRAVPMMLLKKLLLGAFKKFVQLCRPFVTIRVVSFKGNHFGHLVIGPFIYLLQKQREASRVIDFVFWKFPTKKDSPIGDVWAKEIPGLTRRSGGLSWRLLAWLDHSCGSDSSMASHVLRADSYEYHQSPLVNEGLQKQVFDASCVNEANQLFEALGMSGATKIALLHVRDDSYDLSIGKSGLQNFRNASQTRFQRAVDLLLDRGYQVVTVGNDPSSRSSLVGVFEYHRSPHRSELRDLLIFSAASLAIGTDGGAMNPARVFRVPLLITNSVLSYSVQVNCDFAVHILKNWYQDGKLLSHTECWNPALLPVSFQSDGQRMITDECLIEAGVRLEENSEEDIYAATKDILDLGFRPQESLRSIHDPCQSRFWEIFASRRPNPIPPEAIHSSIAPSFLQKNGNWLT